MTFLASQSPRERHGGFTLAEVVISLGIVATSMLALLGMLTIVMGQSRDSASRTVGSQISTRLMGEIQSVPWDDVDAFLALPGNSYRYFNAFGEELDSAVATNPEQESLYTARLIISPDPSLAPSGAIGMTTAIHKPSPHLRRATIYVAAAPGSLGRQKIMTAISTGSISSEIFVQNSLITHFEKQ